MNLSVALPGSSLLQVGITQDQLPTLLVVLLRQPLEAGQVLQGRLVQVDRADASGESYLSEVAIVDTDRVRVVKGRLIDIAVTQTCNKLFATDLEHRVPRELLL